MLKIKQYIKTFLLWELLKGLMVTLKHLFSKKITVQYPEENIPISPRFRGRHALRRYPNGEERCIACKLCEVSCPSLAISIESGVRNDGTRRTTKYEIDLFKCIFCGFCEEACPVESIVLTSILGYHFENKGDQIMTKEQLLMFGDQYEKDIVVARKEDAIYK